MPFGVYSIEEVSASDSPVYEVRLHANKMVAIKDSLSDAKAAAQADYEARIRSALSAQVQDVAGLLDETWNAAVEQAAAIANDCVHLTPDPGAAIRTMLNGRTKLHHAAPAKQEGKP
jgi:hypothetical protein